MKASSIRTLGVLSLLWPDVAAFSSSSALLQQRLSSTSLHAAAEGPPQYDKIYGTIEKVESLATGSVLLRIETTEALEYQPGHVLALELQDQSNVEEWADDTKNNGGWMRGPYTVSRCDGQSLDIVIRVVGKKSKALAASPSGTKVRFGGKFKVPILDGIASGSRQVVLISTGVGIGPCIGAIEKALHEAENDDKVNCYPPIALIGSFRDASDIVYEDHLTKLAEQNPTKLSFHPLVTSDKGRLSSSESNLELITQYTREVGMEETHFHLIGNGQMVKEFQTGLKQAGVPETHITIENYFNTRAEANQDAIDRIASVVGAACKVKS